MQISQLCKEAGITVQRGGGDRRGYVYGADEYHFDFQLLDRALFFRYRRFGESGKWFVNSLFPDGRTGSLTSTSIHEADVMQALTFYLWCEQEHRQGTRFIASAG
jgi:hypothetical protein